jgi:hypothetical protein
VTQDGLGIKELSSHFLICTGLSSFYIHWTTVYHFCYIILYYIILCYITVYYIILYYIIYYCIILYYTMLYFIILYYVLLYYIILYYIILYYSLLYYVTSSTMFHYIIPYLIYNYVINLISKISTFCSFLELKPSTRTRCVEGRDEASWGPLQPCHCKEGMEPMEPRGTERCDPSIVNIMVVGTHIHQLACFRLFQYLINHIHH